MKGRPSIHQNNELVLKAQEIFWRKGYNATSLADLTNATGAGAGSLYNTFKGGKKQLFKLALQQRRADLITFKAALAQSEQPITLIRDFFLSMANTDKNAHLKGCIIANTLIEMTFIDDELQMEASQILKDTEQLYSTVIAKEQHKGNITSTVPADILAKYLITFWCGINSLRRIYTDEKTLKTQIEFQLKMLD